MRRYVGDRFLEYVPTADPTLPAVVAALRRYVDYAWLDEFIPDLLEQRAQDLEDGGLTARDAYVQALCWVYMMDEWLFEHVNTGLRVELLPFLQPLAPYIWAMLGLFNPSLRAAADLRLFRCTVLSEKQLAEYEPGSGLRGLGCISNPKPTQ